MRNPTTSDQRMSIARTQGEGVSSVSAALAALGWKLEGIAGSSTSDTFELERIAK
jgi:precorrin-6B methylase 1